jgi:hypothetical protein
MNKPRYILTAALAAFCLAASSFAATGDIPYSQQGTNGQNVGHVWNGTGFVYVNSGGGTSSVSTNVLTNNGSGTLTTLTVSSNATVNSLQVGTDLSGQGTLSFTDSSGSTLTSITASYGQVDLPAVVIGQANINTDGSAAFGGGPCGANWVSIDALGNLGVNGASTLTQIVIPPDGGNSGTVTLLAGSAVYTNTATITESCVVIVSMKTPSGTPGIYAPLAHAGTGTISFSGLPTDNSTYNWAIVNCTNN